MFFLNFSYRHVWLWYNRTRKLFLLSMAVQVFLLFLCFFPCFSPSFYIFFFHGWIHNEICGNSDKWKMWRGETPTSPHPLAMSLNGHKFKCPSMGCIIVPVCLHRPRKCDPFSSFTDRVSAFCICDSVCKTLAKVLDLTISLHWDPYTALMNLCFMFY